MIVQWFGNNDGFLQVFVGSRLRDRPKFLLSLVSLLFLPGVLAVKRGPRARGAEGLWVMLFLRVMLVLWV